MGRYFACAPLVLGFWRRVRLRSGGGQDNDRLGTPSEEVEDEKEDPKAEPLIEPPRQLARIQLDTLVGMGISNIIALFIMITPNSRSFPKSGFGNRATKFLSLPSPFRQCGRTPLVVEVWPVVLTLTAN